MLVRAAWPARRVFGMEEALALDGGVAQRLLRDSIVRVCRLLYVEVEMSASARRRAPQREGGGCCYAPYCAQLRPRPTCPAQDACRAMISPPSQDCRMLRAWHFLMF